MPLIQLTKIQLKQIDDAIVAIEAAKAEITRAKSAGLDVSQFEQQILDNETKLRAIKQVYGDKSGRMTNPIVVKK
jgi:hypothetical protein